MLKVIFFQGFGRHRLQKISPHQHGSSAIVRQARSISRQYVLTLSASGRTAADLDF